jgi:membrane protease YdiL (CAAX protease family)
MKKIFWNRKERRIKSGWRAIIFFFVYIAFISVTVLLRLAAGRTIVTTFVAILALFAATAVALWFVSRFVDHRGYREFGLGFDKKWWQDIICGFLISALVFIVVFAIEHALGWTTVTQLLKNEKDVFVNFPFVPILLIALLAHTGIVLLEEIYFRGYLIKNLAEGFNSRRVNSRMAVVLAYTASSILFALFHIRNPNISMLGVVNILILGLFFGLPYLLTGEIALSISLHASWNFFMGVVFGFPISGSMEEVAVIATQQSGPVIWTGGNFGPEGGLIGLFAMLTGCVLTVLWIRLSRRRLSLVTRLAEYSHSNTSN